MFQLQLEARKDLERPTPTHPQNAQSQKPLPPRKTRIKWSLLNSIAFVTQIFFDFSFSVVVAIVALCGLYHVGLCNYFDFKDHWGQVFSLFCDLLYLRKSHITLTCGWSCKPDGNMHFIFLYVFSFWCTSDFLCCFYASA